MPAMPPSARPHRRPSALPAGLALALCLPACHVQAAERYALDPVHTRILFSVSHAGFSQALGTISGSTGTLEFDPGDWSGARLQVEVPLQRLDLGDARWNRATLARNLLDGGRWPLARFVSQRVEPRGEQEFTVYGVLTLRGVSREVALEVRMNGLRRHPLPPFRRTAGFSASTTLSRSAFGVDGWPSLIGDEVQVRIEAEAVRERGTRPDDDADTGHEQIPSAATGTNPPLPESTDP